jgi:hypothetical protein
MSEPVGLGAFLALVERHGAFTVGREKLDRELGGRDRSAAILAALAKERVVREAPAATTLPCPELHVDCARDVRTVSAGKKGLHAVAVCGRSPRECETTEPAPHELEEIAISLHELAALARRLLSIETIRHAPPALPGTILLGEQPHAAGRREVMLVTTLSEKEVAALLELVDRAPRPTLLLLPTP